MLRKFLILTAAASVVAVAGLATPALASSTIPIGFQSSGGQGWTQNGTATITRSGSSVTVAISLNAGSAFSGAAGDLQICASTQAFTSKVNMTSCNAMPSGQFSQYTESGSTATETITLGTGFSGVAYLQIHLNTIDNTVANTSEVNPVDNSTPLYGNVAVNPDGTEVPVGAIGAIGLAAIVGLAFVVLQRRRRRPPVVA
jgi:hypothetical protein